MSKAQQELFDFKSPGKSAHVYTVSEITNDIKIIVDNTFQEVWVEGELSNVRLSGSGHVYLSLKDSQALLQAVVFSRIASLVKFKLEDGLKVICYGKVEVYAPQGKYQLIIEKIEPKGVGSLQLALEQLKQKLEKEGLFSPEHKRPIPYLPRAVGIVTSLQGAAIKDILKVLERRFKDTHIIINPVKVQGDGAKEEIAGAIREFNIFNDSLPRDERIEVLIVGRGGGSIEDLWAFNEEMVARAIYNSHIPVISAVGHERDVTISDLVADVRASTPSVAAEMVLPRKEDLETNLNNLVGDIKRSFQDICLQFEDEIDDFMHRLKLGAAHIFELDKNRLDGLIKKLELLSPALAIHQYLTKITDLAKQINNRAADMFKIKQAKFSATIDKLASLSPLNILARGYSITFLKQNNAIIKDTSLVNVGDSIETRLHNGRLLSRITEKIQIESKEEA